MTGLLQSPPTAPGLPQPPAAPPSVPRRRVLVCGPGYRLKFANFFHAFDKALMNGLIRAGHHVRHVSDRDTADGAFLGWRAIGRPVVQRHLREVAEAFEPDILLLLQADLVAPATVRAIRAALPGLVVANVDCDCPRVAPAMRRIERFAPVVDATFVTSGGRILADLRRRIGPAFFLPNPLDPAILDAGRHAGIERTHDIVLATRAGDRFAFLDRVRAAAPELRALEIGRDGRALYGRTFERALCSARAGLNLSGHNTDLFSSDRIAQLFGLGLCVCIPEATGYRDLLGEDAAIWFDDAGDLARRLVEALRSGRWRAIADAGRAAYLAQFESTIVADYLVARLSGTSVGALAWADRAD